MNVDRRSTFVNIELTTDPSFGVTASNVMAPREWPTYDEEDVTGALRQEIVDTLAANESYNKARGLKRGDERRLIGNRSELAKATDMDKTLLNKIIAGDTQRSTYVGRIRDVLKLQPVIQITVPLSRAEVLQSLARLPDAKFKGFRDAVLDEIDQLKREPRK